jgi:hypothetical protein
MASLCVASRPCFTNTASWTLACMWLLWERTSLISFLKQLLKYNYANILGKEIGNKRYREENTVFYSDLAVANHSLRSSKAS